jgi:hypothetical protein
MNTPPGKYRTSRGGDDSVFIEQPGKDLLLRKFGFIIAAQQSQARPYPIIRREKFAFASHAGSSGETNIAARRQS